MEERDQITALKEFYGHYDPKNVPGDADLQDLTKRYAGKEKQMWGELYGHYEKKAPPSDEDLSLLAGYANPFSSQPPGKQPATQKEGALGGSSVSPAPSETGFPATPEPPIGAEFASSPGMKLAQPGDFFQRKQAEIKTEQDANPVFQAPTLTGDVAVNEARNASTEDILNAYMDSILDPGMRDDISERAAIRDLMKQDPQAVMGMAAEVQKIRGKPGDEKQKVLEAKNLIASWLDENGLAYARDKVNDDISGNEAAMEISDPRGFSAYKYGQMLKRDEALGLGRSEAQSQRAAMARSIPEVFGDQPGMAEEADLNMKLDVLKAKDFSYADADPKAKDELERKRQSEIEETQYRIDELKNKRLEDLDRQIAAAEDALDRMPPSKQLTDALNELKAKRKGFFKPEQKAAEVYVQYAPEIDAQPGKTPQERMRQYYASLSHQQRELWNRYGGNKSAGEFTANELASVFGQDSKARDRYTEITRRMQALAPVVLLNAMPENEDSFLNAAKRSFTERWLGNSGLLTDMANSRQHDIGEIQQAMAVAGVSPDDLTQGRAEEMQRGMGKYTMLDPRRIGELVGTSAALMTQLVMPGGAVSRIPRLVKAGQTATRGMKALGYLEEAVRSGASYELAGEVFRNDDNELSFMGGFFGGLGRAATMAGLNKTTNAVKGLFGDKTKEAIGAIANFASARAGAGLGEVSEEFSQQLVQIWRESGPGKTFTQAFNEQFPDWDAAMQFALDSFVMGAFMGGGHQGGAGQALIQASDNALSQLPEEQREEVQGAIDEITEASEQVNEGALEGAPAAEESQQQAPAQEVVAEEETIATPEGPETITAEESAMETPAAEVVQTEETVQDAPPAPEVTEEQITAAREAVSRPVAAPSGDLKPGDRVSYTTGPRGSERQQDGVVESVDETGRPTLTIDVGGTPTTVRPNPANITRLDAPQDGFTEDQKTKQVLEVATPIGQNLAAQNPDFESWSSAMEETLGEEVRPYLQSIWERVQAPPRKRSGSTNQRGFRPQRTARSAGFRPTLESGTSGGNPACAIATAAGFLTTTSQPAPGTKRRG